MLLSLWPQLSLNTVPPYPTPTHTDCLFPWTLLGTLSQPPPVNPNSCPLPNLHFLWYPAAPGLCTVGSGTWALHPQACTIKPLCTSAYHVLLTPVKGPGPKKCPCLSPGLCGKFLDPSATTLEP